MSKYLLRTILIGTGIVLAVTGPFPTSKQEADPTAKPTFSATVDDEWLSKPIDLKDLSFASVVSTEGRLQ